MARINGLVCGLVLFASGSAFAQVVQERTTTTAAPAPAGTTQVRRISHLIGSHVRLQGNNNFGKVDDVVLDQNGGISYLVVSNGGKYAMFPWNPASVNYGQRYVTYDVTPTAVQPLFFAQDAWPNITDRQFIARTQQVFPNTAPVRREVLRPVEGTVPPPAGTVAPPPGTAPVPPGGVIEQKVKERPNGTVKIQEKVRP